MCQLKLTTPSRKKDCRPWGELGRIFAGTALTSPDKTLNGLVTHIQRHHDTCDQQARPSQKTRDIGPMLHQYWASVVDDGLALVQHWVDVLCVLGCDEKACAMCGPMQSPRFSE